MLRRILALIMTFLLFPSALAAGATATLCPTDGSEANALRAAQALNGTILLPGARFSFLNAVGPLTAENGYTEAQDGSGAVILGGGIAQTAQLLVETLSGLPSGAWCMEAMSYYGECYTGSYALSGGQAVRVDSNTDLQFTNLSGGRMVLQLQWDGASLRCTILLESDQPAPSQNAAAGALEVGRSRHVSLTPSGSASALRNAVLAANSLYDLTLGTGDCFSFNAGIGSRDSRFGYQPAEDGRGAIVPGGGVDQVACLVWLAIQSIPEISILEKNVYGNDFVQTYAPSAGDAIRTDPDSGIDFVFLYTGQGTLSLYPAYDGSALTCTILISDP